MGQTYTTVLSMLYSWANKLRISEPRALHLESFPPRPTALEAAFFFETTPGNKRAWKNTLLAPKWLWATGARDLLTAEVFHKHQHTIIVGGPADCLGVLPYIHTCPRAGSRRGIRRSLSAVIFLARFSFSLHTRALISLYLYFEEKKCVFPIAIIVCRNTLICVQVGTSMVGTVVCLQSMYVLLCM